MPQSLNGGASVWKTDGRFDIGLQVRILSAAFGEAAPEKYCRLGGIGKHIRLLSGSRS